MLDVLVVDDDAIVRESIATAISDAGHRVCEAGDGEKALSLLATRPFDLAVCDVQMPRVDGLTLFRSLRRDSPGTAVVIMTTYGRIPDAVGTLRDGAIDYVTKPFDPDEFVQKVVTPLAERRALRQKFEEARAQLVTRDTGAALIGASLAMRRLAERAAVFSTSDAPVFILGASGAGRKLVARTIHAQSPRRDGPFLVVPCAALPDLMLESELREISELRARSSRDEWFRAAEGGTLVLDGIDGLSPAAQSNLLRIIDDPLIRARRDRDWQPLGVRVVSVSQTSPADLIAAGRFLEPLLYRLNAVQLHVPSLREREGDLAPLTLHLLRELTPPGSVVPGVTPRAWKALSDHPFPGNVRELAWALEHAILASRGGEIDREHLPEGIG